MTHPSPVNSRPIPITAAFHTVAATNAYLETHPAEGVLAEHCGLILVARCDDKGEN